MNFKFGLKLSIAFFVIGTVILLVYYSTMSPMVALLAFQYNMLAMLVSWIYAGFLLFKFLRRQITLSELLKTLAVMLVNIPVGILYAYIMSVLLNYARVDIQNISESPVTNLVIKGCEEKSIPNLESGENETAWVKLAPNCSIILEYSIGGQHKQDTVLFGISPGEGSKVNYAIDL
jgi:hypothetical protein